MGLVSTAPLAYEPADAGVDADAASRHIDTPRHGAAAWHAWLQAQAQALQPLADAVPQALAAQRLVVVAPHPDDELLCCGLLMQAHARRGGAVHIVGVTDGEASHADAPGWPPERLARVRQGERLRGLQALQMPPPALTSLHLPDGGVAPAESALREALQRLLQPGDVVVTTWQRDGHPDHEACGRATLAAAHRAGVAVLQAPVWAWHWARLADPAVPWERLCRLDAHPADLERKQRALRRHASQCRPRGPGLPPVLDDAILARAAWPDEFFIVEPAP